MQKKSLKKNLIPKVRSSVSKKMATNKEVREEEEESKHSKETLERVALMKARVQATVQSRLKENRDRNLRQMRFNHKLKELDLSEDEASKYKKEFLANERSHLREKRQKTGLKDFSLVKVIGKGAFGEVRIVRHKTTKTPYAMKTMRKEDMMAKNQVDHVQSEKNLMSQAVDNPWFAHRTHLNTYGPHCATARPIG